MTLRLIFGVDPGLSGAFALLADGVSVGFIDMPLRSRNENGNEIDWRTLAAKVRAAIREHIGAYVMASVEKVNAMPSIPGKDGLRRSMGAQSALRFGESSGGLKSMLETMDIPYILVPPQVWKRELRLTGLDKDAARQLVIKQFPECAEKMKRKKDVGRADALLIAHYAERVELVAKAA